MQNSPINPKEHESIAVIGGGIIGLFSALSLQESGKQVVLIERGEIGGRQAASFGNGCWISPGAVMPISYPGLWRSVPRFLMDPSGPFSVRWQYLPKLAGWLLRFIWAGRNWTQIEDQVSKRLPLLKQPVQRYLQLGTEAGVADLIRQCGAIYLYRSKKELEADQKGWDLRRDSGVSLQILNGEELRQIEPDLSPDYQYGVLMPDAAMLTDPGAFCAALAKLFVKRGGTHLKGEISEFIFNGEKLAGLRTETEEICCDKAVVAAGIWSKKLAALLGDKIPLVSERGYHITIAEPDVQINHGLMPADGKMAVVTTTTGLRLAGQVELSSVDAPPRWERAHIQLAHAYRLFPKLNAAGKNHDIWMGHRPSTPDSLPVICRSKKSPDIIYAFGHGHTGISMAPDTGLLVAGLADDNKDAEKLSENYLARRF